MTASGNVRVLSELLLKLTNWQQTEILVGKKKFLTSETDRKYLKSAVISRSERKHVRTLTHPIENSIPRPLKNVQVHFRPYLLSLESIENHSIELFCCLRMREQRLLQV